MNRFLKEKEFLKRLARLIRLGATGTAKECAGKMGTSERTIHRKMKTLSDMGPKIYYNAGERTYLHHEATDPNAILKDFSEKELTKTLGGIKPYNPPIFFGDKFASEPFFENRSSSALFFGNVCGNIRTPNLFNEDEIITILK